MAATESDREREITRLYGDLHRHAGNDFARTVLLPRFLHHLAHLGLDARSALCGRSFLDAGCGGFAGGVSIALGLGANPIVGVDLSEANISEARRRFRGEAGVTFVRDNLISLDVRSDSFDFVYCTGVLHHTEAPERAFRELVRVLRPGGRLYVGVYGSGGFYNDVAVPIAKMTGRLVPRPAMARLVGGFPRLLRPSTSLLDVMYAPIERHYRIGDIEHWFRAAGLESVFLRHPEQPDTAANRLLFGNGTMLYFSGMKPLDA